MKKTIIAISLILLANITQASYIIKIPIEESNGGQLPNGSITINTKEPNLPIDNWKLADSLYSEWFNEGELYGCSWLPSASNVLQGESFNQSAIDCKQNQSMTIQNREQELTTLKYRNVGIPVVYDTQTIILNANRTTLGTAACVYDPTSLSETFWMSANPDTESSYIYVKGVYVYHIVGARSFTLNNFKYSIGKLMKNGTDASHPAQYEVCRSIN